MTIKETAVNQEKVVSLSSEAMMKVTIIQTRSAIRCTERQRATLRGLGLKKIGSKVVRELNGSSVGMIKVVEHLVAIFPA